jgi:hypothetical protein
MSDDTDAAELEAIREMRPVRVQPDLSRRDAHRFGFDALARTLARLILDRENGTPLTIGIHGPWGSGKTSFMETTRAMVDRAARQRRRSDAGLRNCRTVWFNAWKYAGEEAVPAALLQEIISQMKQDGLVDRLRAEIKELRGKYEWGALVGSILQGAFGLFTGGVPVPVPDGRRCLLSGSDAYPSEILQILWSFRRSPPFPEPPDSSASGDPADSNAWHRNPRSPRARNRSRPHGRPPFCIRPGRRG